MTGESDVICERIQTQRPVYAFLIEAKKGGMETIRLKYTHNGMLYLLSVSVTINFAQDLKLEENQLIQFSQDEEGFTFEANSVVNYCFFLVNQLMNPLRPLGN